MGYVKIGVDSAYGFSAWKVNYPKLLSTFACFNVRRYSEEEELWQRLEVAESAALKGEKLEAARSELERRLADTEATLEAERARLTAEAAAAAVAAVAEAATLRSQLEVLRESLVSRDIALAEVGRCGLTVAKPEVKAPVVSALETIISESAFDLCFHIQPAPLY